MQQVFTAKRHIGKPCRRQPFLVSFDGFPNVIGMVMQNNPDEVAALREILIPRLIDIQAQTPGHARFLSRYEKGEVRTSPF